MLLMKFSFALDASTGTESSELDDLVQSSVDQCLVGCPGVPVVWKRWK